METKEAEVICNKCGKLLATEQDVRENSHWIKTYQEGHLAECPVIFEEEEEDFLTHVRRDLPGYEPKGRHPIEIAEAYRARNLNPAYHMPFPLSYDYDGGWIDWTEDLVKAGLISRPPGKRRKKR